MNIQLFAYDEDNNRYEVDLYESEPILLNLAIEDILDPTSVNSSFSKNFRIPATQWNSQVFEWWYEVNTIDFDIAKKVPAEIYVDGLIFKKGHVRIEAAYFNGSADNIDLELVFYGETRDFSTQVGGGFLHQLDCSDATFTLIDVTDIEDTWSAVEAPIRFFLADRGYDYDDSGQNPVIVADQGEVAFEISKQHDKSFHKPQNPISIFQFTPGVQVKYLIDRIFDSTSYSYTADSIFNEEWFKNLYIDGNPEASATIDKYLENSNVEYTKPPSQSIFALNTWTTIDFRKRVSDPGPFFDGVFYTVQYTENLDIDVNFEYNVTGIFASAVSITAQLMYNNAAIDTFSDSGVTFIQGVATLSYTSAQPALPAGGQVWVRVQMSSSLGFSTGWVRDGLFRVTNTALIVNPSQLLRKDLKTIDFLRTIMTKFKLVMEPDAYKENLVKIKPWVNYIGKGDKYDWTHKLDESKDVILKPLFYDQSATIYFTDSEGKDAINTFHQDTFVRTYGDLYYNSLNELLIGENTIETLLAPTPSDQVIDIGNPDSNFIIPHFYRWGEDTADHGNVKRLPVATQPRLLFWNGLAPINSQPTGPNIEEWFYTDFTTTKSSNDPPLYDGVNGRYPRVSNVSELPTTSTTLNLNWFKEFAYYDIDRTVPIGRDGDSVYTRYWEYYVDNLYSSRARLMTAYFTLDAQDLKDLTFDDAIFIKSSWWRPVAVYDAPINELSSVKVDLIKLQEYPGGQSGITGDGSFGGAGGDYGSSGGNWGGSSSGTSGTGGDTSGTSGTSGLQTRYYELYDCLGEMAPIIASFTGGVQPTIGYVCEVSGIPYAGKCFTIVRMVQGPAMTTILQTYPDCESCLP